jgi:hypothetical protein
MLRQSQHSIPQHLDGLGTLKVIENRVMLAHPCRMAAVPVVVVAFPIPARPGAAACAIIKCHVAAFSLPQLSQVVARNAVQERGWGSLFFIELPGLADQTQECLLHNVGCGVGSSRHMQSIPINAALMPAVEFQERALVAFRETPHKFDIAQFDSVGHQPNRRMSSGYSDDYFRRGVKFHFLVPAGAEVIKLETSGLVYPWGSFTHFHPTIARRKQ